LYQPAAAWADCETETAARAAKPAIQPSSGVRYRRISPIHIIRPSHNAPEASKQNTAAGKNSGKKKTPANRQAVLGSRVRTK